MIESTDQAIMALLDQRGAGKTICPSEAAKRIAASSADGLTDWRAFMPQVHAAADALLAAGEVRLSWKGEEISQRRGAYRIARR